jgi:hypothetical protein
MRRRVLECVAFILCVFVAGCGEESTAPPSTPVRVIDAEPAWSHDKTKVAFVRLEASSLGPVGLYVMDYPQGTVRLVRALNPEGMRGLRFTGDDTHLLVGWSGAIVLIDVATGDFANVPVDATNAALPDDTADGSAIAYVRPGSTLGTLWQYEFATPRDSVSRIDGNPGFGTYPRYSPGDSLLAWVDTDGVHVLRRATGQGTRVTTTSYPSNYHTVPRWLDANRILFNEVSNSGQRYFVVDRTSGVRTEMPLGIYDSEAISPLGDSIVVQGYDTSDPDTSRILLFVRGITSQGSTARQITRFLRSAGP